MKKKFNLKRKTILSAIAVLFMISLLSSCADTTACQIDDPYGFWGGLWHGIILFFSFIGSLFSDDIAVYACNNNGGWYDFGFWLGASLMGYGVGSKT